MSRKMGIIRSDPRKILSGLILGLIRIQEAAPQQVLPHSSSSSGSFYGIINFSGCAKLPMEPLRCGLKALGFGGFFVSGFGAFRCKFQGVSSHSGGLGMSFFFLCLFAGKSQEVLEPGIEGMQEK